LNQDRGKNYTRSFSWIVASNKLGLSTYQTPSSDTSAISDSSTETRSESDHSKVVKKSVAKIEWAVKYKHRLQEKATYVEESYNSILAFGFNNMSPMATNNLLENSTITGCTTGGEAEMY
jgi:hypothetical protein